MQIPIQPTTGQATASGSGVVIFDLKPGYRYNRLLLSMASQTSNLIDAATSSYLSPILLKVNDNVQRSITVGELNSLNSLNNAPSTTYGTAATFPYSWVDIAAATAPGAQISMYFDEPFGRYDPMQRFALDVLAKDKVTLEVPWTYVATGAPIVYLNADVEPLADVLADRNRGRLNRFDNGTEGGIPTLVKYLRGSETPAGTQLTITKWLKNISRFDAVQHIRLRHPIGFTISSVDFQVNQRSWTGLLTAKQNGKLLRDMGMNPTAVTVGSAASVYGGAEFDYDIVPNASGSPRDGWTFNPNDSVEIVVNYNAAVSAVPQDWITQAFGPVI